MSILDKPSPSKFHNDTPTLFSSFFVDRLIDASVVAIWIFLSATMVFYNKFLLSYFGFYFPITVSTSNWL